MGKPAPEIETQRIDLNELMRMAESQAERNIAKSIGLEKQFAPEAAAFRTQAMSDLLGSMGQGDDQLEAFRQQLSRDFFADPDQLDMPELQRSELFDQASAQVLAELGLGGQLDPETRNLVMREAAQRGGGSGFLGGVIGRDIGARDLGLSSMNLQQQRLAQALNVGGMQQAQNLQQQGLKGALNQANVALRQQGLQNRMGIGGFFEGLQAQDMATKMGLAQFGQSIQMPMAGLDPGQLASAAIGDINMMNQMSAQSAQNKLSAQQAFTENAMNSGLAVAKLFGG